LRAAKHGVTGLSSVRQAKPGQNLRAVYGLQHSEESRIPDCTTLFPIAAATRLSGIGEENLTVPLPNLRRCRSLSGVQADILEDLEEAVEHMDETGLIRMIYLTPVGGRGSSLEQVSQRSICDDLVVPLLKLVESRIPNGGVESTGLLSQLAAYVQKRRYDG
jgi:hypothetical protein